MEGEREGGKRREAATWMARVSSAWSMSMVMISRGKEASLERGGEGRREGGRERVEVSRGRRRKGGIE
jgi:hypothetical protein